MLNAALSPLLYILCLIIDYRSRSRSGASRVGILSSRLVGASMLRPPHVVSGSAFGTLVVGAEGPFMGDHR